jgi:hypothetical protein
MIEYVEIRNASRELIGIIDNAESIIWESAYYSTGQFEIYVKVTPLTVQLLQVGNYVTRPSDVNVGIIENLNITWTQDAGRMIIASGRFAKSLLDRRLIYRLTGTSIQPTTSSGLVEVAVRKLVNDNIIASNISARNVPFIRLGPLQNIQKRILSETGEEGRVQTSYGGLLEHTDSLLQEYFLGAYMSLDRNTKNLLYNVIEGKDRSVGNTSGNAPLIFSQDFDNLLSSNYQYQTTALKTTALIGGEGEGTERFCVMIGEAAEGLSRREVFVDAGSQSKKYKEDSTNDKGEPIQVEKEYSDAVYADMLKAHGQQNIAQLQIVETFTGDVDVINSDKVFGKDFWIGDIITIQDTQLSAYINTRILTATEVQDTNGYQLAISYGV